MRLLKVVPSWLGQSVTLRVSLAITLVLCGVALLSANWLLLRENGRLQAAGRVRSSAMAPRVGASVPPLRGVVQDGTLTTVDYAADSRQTLLFVFSTECAISDLNWPTWSSIARQIDPRRYRVVFVNLSESLPAAFLDSHPFPRAATIIGRLDPASALAYNLTLSPNVLLIDQDATIQQMWLGIPEAGEIERALGIWRPALAP